MNPSGMRLKIKMHSVAKETDWLELKQNSFSKSPFNTGETASFKLKTYNIGKPAFIEIG